MDPSARHVPLWVSTNSQIQQTSTTLSENLSLKMGNPIPFGQNVQPKLGFRFQDQDSSSAQSTGQSDHEMSIIGVTNSCRPKIKFAGLECDQILKHEAHQLKPVSSVGNQECVVPSQVNFGQSYACVALPYADPYYDPLFAQTMNQYSQMVGIGPVRVPLPLDLLQNEPIYVNAKQYHAILRRRQYRAKLEAQNKLSKSRKPYLHESRHLHALKRARGTGGRFINTKNIQDSKAATKTKDNFTATKSNIKNSGSLSTLLRTAASMVKTSLIWQSISKIVPRVRMLIEGKSSLAISYLLLRFSSFFFFVVVGYIQKSVGD